MGDYMRQQVREADIHFIVNELIAHAHCVDSKERLFGALQLPPRVEAALENKNRWEGSFYGYFKEMIASWIQLKGNEASTYAFDKALREIGWNAVADNLRDKWFTADRPIARPSNVRDAPNSIQTASTLGQNTNESEPQVLGMATSLMIGATSVSNSNINNCQVRVADIHFIAIELTAHAYCVDNKERLFGALQLPPRVETALENKYRWEGSFYGYFKEMIASWIHLKGNEASPYALDKALREIGWNAVADNLRDKWFTEDRPTAGPSTVRFAPNSIQTGSTLGQTTNESEPHVLEMATSFMIGATSVSNSNINNCSVVGKQYNINSSDSNPAKKFIWFNTGEPIPSYTGREDKLDEVYSLFFPTNKEIKPIHQIAIVGLGGVGKSEFARKFAKLNYNQLDQNVVWINAKSAQLFIDSFKELATLIGIKFAELSGKAEIHRMVRQVYEYFGEKKSLFIFDNVETWVDGEGAVKDYLPNKMAPSAKKPFVLLTSRKRPCGIKLIELSVLEVSEAVELIETRLDVKKVECVELLVQLANLLGCLPLALQQASSYIKQEMESDISGKQQNEILPGYIENYVKAFKVETKKLLDYKPKEMDVDFEELKTTLLTWRLTLGKIQNLNTSAIQILELMSYISPDEIHLKMFEAQFTDDDLRVAVSRLVRFSMITKSSNIVSVHRLVQAVVRLDSGDKQESTLPKKKARKQDVENRPLESVLNLLNNILKELPGKITPYTTSCVVHAQVAWNHALAYPKLLKRFKKYPRKLYKKAELHGMHTTNLLLLQRTLSKYKEYSSYKKSSEMDVDEWKTWKSTLEKIQKLNPSATQLLEMMSYISPDDIHLEMFEAQFTVRNLKAATNTLIRFSMISKHSANPNIVSVHRPVQSVVRLDQEENSLKEVLKLLNAILKELPDKITPYSTSCVIHAQVAWEYALAYPKLLKQFEAYPANLYKKAELHGMHTSNLSLLQRTLSKYKLCSIYGESDEQYIRIQHLIASGLLDLQKYDDAKLLWKTIHKTAAEKLGDSHWLTLGILNDLAVAEDRLGNYSEQIIILDKVIAIETATLNLGPYHTHTLTSLHNKAAGFVHMGKHDEALELFKSTLELEEKHHPGDRKSINSTRYWIAITTHRLGNFAEALLMFRNVHAERVESFGESHTDTLSCAREIGECLLELGKYEEAMELLKYNLNLAIDNPGAQLQCVNMQFSIAKVLLQMERYDDAIREFRIVLGEQLSIYREAHPQVLVTREWLADALKNAGQTAEALEHYKYVYENRMKTLGRDHSDTISVKECMDCYKERDEANVQNISTPGQLNEPIWFNMRDPISSFTGRQGTLEHVHNIFFSAKFGQQEKLRQVAVVGLGGIGKTEFARKFATVFYLEFDCNVAWINAGSRQLLQESFKELARKVLIYTTNISGKEDYPEMITTVYEHFSESNSLFIFDNVEAWLDGEDAIKDYLPQGQKPSSTKTIYILMTSRIRPKVSKCVEIVELSVLTEPEAVQLIQRRLDTKNSKLPSQLAKLLGCLPLALQQAISYIQQEIEEDISGMARQEVVARCIQSYTEIFDTESKKLLDYKDMDFDADFEEIKTTRDVWRVTLDDIREMSPNGMHLLSMMSYISPDDIQLKIFEAEYTDDDLKAAINALLDFSMIIKQSIQTNTIRVHRLVQRVVRLEIEEKHEHTLENEKVRSRDEAKDKPLESILNLLELILRELPDIITPFSTSCVIHAQKAWEYAIALPKLLKQFKDFPTILYNKAKLHGMHTTNLPLLRRTLSKYSEYKIYKESDEQYIAVQYLITNALLELHKYEDAKSLCSLIHETAANELGESHQLALAILNNLALAEDGLGNYLEQMTIPDKVIAASSASPNIGSHHKDTLTSLHNKAASLASTGKYDEDLEIFKSMLELKEKHQPEDRKSINDTRYWIALTIQRQGNFVGALKTFRYLHAELVESFGESHRKTLRCARQIEECLLELGNAMSA